MGSADIAANIENWDYTFFYLGENEQEFQALKQEIEADEEVAELVEWHSGMFVGDVPSDNYSSEYWESICEICNLYGVSDQEFEERYKSEHLSFNVLAVDDVTLKESEIYKLVVLLKEQSGHATRQNVYLADMLSDISHQIKTHIIKNCIEHTPAGGKVIIFAEQNNFATNIRISDNGEGIAKEHLPHIFERFYKGANTSSNSVGIGLAMSKQIIMRQNGTVSVTSEKGAGTTFQIKMYV